MDNLATTDAAGSSPLPFGLDLKISANAAPSTPASKDISTFRFVSKQPGTPTPKRRRYNRDVDVGELEVASTVEMPGSPTVARQGPNMAAETSGIRPYRPRSTAAEKIDRIRLTIAEEELSMRGFLEALFKAEDSDDGRQMAQFYSNNGPSIIMNIWRQKLRKRPKWAESFVEAAVDIVVERTRRDLRDSSKGVIGQVEPPLGRAAYRFPHHCVTQTNIKHVIDRGFLSSYVNHARPLMRLLEGVLSNCRRKRKALGKRSFEMYLRDGNMDHSDRRHIDDGEDEAEEEMIEEEEGVEGEDVDREDAKAEEYDEMMGFVNMIESQRFLRLAEAIEADRDAEKQDAVQVEEAVKEEEKEKKKLARRRPHRNPVSVRGCIAAMLLFMTSQKCNAFQTVMGVFLYCTGCPTRVLDVLSSLGLSVSDDQVKKALSNMTEDAMNQVRKAILCNDWFVVYDNINIAMKHQHQRIDKLDTFDNGTAATVVLFHTEDDREDDREEVEHDEKVGLDEASEHDERDLEDNLNGDPGPCDRSGTSGQNSADSEAGDEGDDESGKSDYVHERHPSRPVIVVHRPDRLSVPGASIFFPNATDRTLFRNVCRHHFSSAIARTPAYVVPIVEVDLLPIRKSTTFPLRTMKIDESTIAGNLSVLDTIMLVGLGLTKTWFASHPNIIVAGDQMTVARLLSLRIHRAIDPDPYGSLSWVSPIPQLFHLRMTLCGTIFRTHYGDDNTRGTLATIISLLRRKQLTKDNMNFKVADELLRLVFEALSLVLADFLTSNTDAADKVDVPRVADLIIDTLTNLGPLTESSTPMLRGRPCTTADINALLLLRDIAVYIELGSAIKAGDIGRIRSLLPTITLMMHGGGNTNYARELLRLLHGVRHTWTVEWERRVLSSMLINPEGVRDGWMATDMYQETNNYLLKAVFAAKGPNMSWEYLKDHVSTNIRANQEIARMFEQAVDAKFHNPFHVRTSSDEDLKKVKMSFHNSGILTWRSGKDEDKREFPDPVVDLQREGGSKMVGGALDKFLSNGIDHHGAAELEETEASAIIEHVD
ncbi:unnamed protein product [Mortierella alpina]